METKSQANKICEVDGNIGIFTEGIDNKYDAYNAMLDWYYSYHTDEASRFYFADYWAISVDQIDLERIEESYMMKCNGACEGNYWIGDTECPDCDRPLDKRTKKKTFYLYW